ncbi:MAG: hypothetical protein FWG46_08025 [Treponema sp.]|nr:hypothetical protein [Treponema sp.]
MNKILLPLFFFAVLPPLFCDPLEDLTGAQRAAELRVAEGPITEVQLKNPRPLIAPSHELVRAVLTGAMGSLEPNLFVETLSLYRKPEGGAAWSSAERTALFNQLTALSTLAGIQYYSESRKTMRTFYESSQVIDSPANKNPLPDPVFAAPPSALTIFARQKDLTFGDNIYRFDYSTGADAIIFVQINETAMNVAVGKNKFRTVIAAIDAGDSILIYAAAMAKTAALPGIGDRIGSSFTNRAQAILTWFTARANNVFR